MAEASGARSVFSATMAALIASLPGALPGQQPPMAGASAATEAGYGVFQQKCTTCHGNPQFDKAPPPEVLFKYTPERIYDSLTKGVMAGVTTGRRGATGHEPVVLSGWWLDRSNCGSDVQRKE